MSAPNPSRPGPQPSYFAGLDWGHYTHHVVLLDPRGRRVMTLSFDHDAAGWARLRQKLRPFAGEDLASVAVAIETRVGPVVEKLLELGCRVYPIQPLAAARYRDRKAPAGVKDDLLDAWSHADALRVDGHHWRPLEPPDDRIRQLRLLCRDEVRLIQQRTALVNALREALHEYYPAALQAFDDWTLPATWAFVQRFATPQKLRRAGKRAWDKFLHTHRLYRPSTYDRRIACFRNATDFCGGPAVTEAKSLLATSLAAQLRALQTQLDAYRRQIDSLAAHHPAYEMFASLPGLGEKLLPRLLSECANARRRHDAVEGIECCAGVAPVRFQSGQMCITRMRRACIKPLRAAVHLWANASRAKSVWAQAYYQGKRAEGKSHACALRCLGRRWLRILWKLLETGHRYDESLHLRNQLRHGSWVLRPPA